MKVNKYDVFAVNDIILEAVKHGADIGGSYGSNEKDLLKAMSRYARRFGWEGVCIYEEPSWGAPQFGVVIQKDATVYVEGEHAKDKPEANTAHTG